MSIEFKIGDRVNLRQDNQYFGHDIQGNGQSGIITGISSSISVDWNNGDKNTYHPKDLDLIKPLTAKELNQRNICT